MKIFRTLFLSAALGTALAQPPPRPGLTLTASSLDPVSAKLEWTNVPAGVVSFTLILHDPDTAPRRSSEDTLCRLALNIPGSAIGFDPGAVGPCHRCTFELYALDTKLTLAPDAARADVLQAMDGHVAAKAALTSQRRPQPGLVLTSPAFPDGGIIPNRYTQADPTPVSPKLDWSNAPAGVASFALILHDPDGAPAKHSADALHWMVFNIPGNSTGLPENMPAMPAMADGTAQAKNLRGSVGFMGPGAGAAGPYHHYTFELYALDIKLGLGPDATRADVLQAMDGHVLAKAALAGRFHR